MRTLLSFSIVLFIFSNSSCEICAGTDPKKKQDCEGLILVDNKDYCCFTEMGNKEKGNPGNRLACLSFSEEELANKEELLKTNNYVDIDCDLSGPSEEEGANSGNSGNTGNSGNSGGEKERERDSNSSSKLIYLSKAIFILLLLVL